MPLLKNEKTKSIRLKKNRGNGATFYVICLNFGAFTNAHTLKMQSKVQSSFY